MNVSVNDKTNKAEISAAPVTLPEGHFCVYMRCSECPAAYDGLEWHDGRYMYWCSRFSHWEEAHSGCSNPPRD